MTVTMLDPITALIVVDLQVGPLSAPTVHPMAPVVRNARRLADEFRRRALPVVLVNVDGRSPGRADRPSRSTQRPQGWNDLLPELDVQPTDLRVTKRTWGAFTNTGLAELLGDRDVTQVVIAGVVTSIGVESTARQAHEIGYNVTLALDAMTDIDAAAHDNSTTRIFPRLGEIGRTGEIVDLLR